MTYSNDKPTDDELAGMEWWNSLSELEQKYWVEQSGLNSSAAEAWAEWKRIGEQEGYNLASEATEAVRKGEEKVYSEAEVRRFRGLDG